MVTPSLPAGTAIVMDANAVLILYRGQPTLLASKSKRGRLCPRI
jgi:hypothetical protein